MEIKSQKAAFSAYEANSYFARNQSILSDYTPQKDPVIKVLKDYDYTPKRVLEIGCNAGYRLNGIKTVFPNCELYGIEPSSEAIDYGQNTYKGIHFYQGTADNLTQFKDGFFDLVVIGFVLYVVDRNLLFRTISEIDRVLCEDGVLMNIDFFSRVPHKNHYGHIKEVEAYSFKQNYENIFIASHLYQLLDKRSMNHTTKLNDISSDYYNKFVLCTLKKDSLAGY